MSISTWFASVNLEVQKATAMLDVIKNNIGRFRAFLSVLITKTSSFLLQSSVSAIQKEVGKSGQVCLALPLCLSAQMTW